MDFLRNLFGRKPAKENKGATSPANREPIVSSAESPRRSHSSVEIHAAPSEPVVAAPADPSAVEWLLAMLSEGHHSYEVIDGLAQIGDTRALKPLIQQGRSDYGEICLAAMLQILERVVSTASESDLKTIAYQMPNFRQFDGLELPHYPKDKAAAPSGLSYEERRAWHNRRALRNVFAGDHVLRQRYRSVDTSRLRALAKEELMRRRGHE